MMLKNPITYSMVKKGVIILALPAVLGVTSFLKTNPAFGFEVQHVRPVEKWVIEPVSDDGDEIIDFCLARTYYNNGLILIIARDKNEAQRIALNFPDKRLTLGNSYPVKLAVDKIWESSNTAVAASDNMLVISFEKPFNLIKTLGQGYTFSMTSSNDAVEFDLSGVGGALEKLNQCIEKNLPAIPIAPAETKTQIAIATPPSGTESFDSTSLDIPPKAHEKAELSTTIKPSAIEQKKQPPKEITQPNITIPQRITNALALAQYPANSVKVPTNKVSNIPLDFVWSYKNIFAGYKALSIVSLSFNDAIKSYINSMRPLCGGPFIAEASPIYTVNGHNFMHAEIGCSSANNDSIAALLFYETTPETIDSIYLETDSNNGADAIVMRNKISHVIENEISKQ